MYKVLLLFCALLWFLPQSLEAGPGTPYARAKAKGRVYVHRPSYKVYRGSKRRHRSRLFRRSRKRKTHTTPVQRRRHTSFGK